MNVSDAETMSLEQLREIGALGPDFTPKSDLVMRLVRLRAKYILSGGKFLTSEEIEVKLGRDRASVGL